jgi:hypothetical protein
VIPDEPIISKIQLAIIAGPGAYDSYLIDMTRQPHEPLATAKQIKEEYSLSNSFNILEGGHLVGDDGDEILDPFSRILAVPQDIIVNLNTAGDSSITSRRFCIPEGSTVGELKTQLFNRRSEDVCIYDVMGMCLQNNAQLLSSTPLFTYRSCKLICIHQLDRTGCQSHPVRMENVTEIAKKWSSVTLDQDHTALSLRLGQALESVFESSDSDDELHGSTEKLETTKYSSSLPQLEPPEQATSPQLERAKALFTRMCVPQNSACPAQAASILDRLEASLQGYSVGLAEACARAVQALAPPIEFLASKDAKEHRHEAHKTNLCESREALESYRAIQANKIEMYNEIENRDAMLRAKESTSSVGPPWQELLRTFPCLAGKLHEYADRRED